MSFSNSNQSAMDKIKSVDWRGLVRSATNKVKQYAMNLSPLEVQVEEATNMDTWGPHGSVMAEIAEACYDPEGYRQVLGVLARRFQEKDEKWRMCYKALLLLEYLIKHGPVKVAQDVANSTSVLNRLQNFQYKDANGKDHGVNIRHRAQEIIDLVVNPEKLQLERQKAAENKAKYTGVSASQMRAGAVGFGSTQSMSSARGFDRHDFSRSGDTTRNSFGSSQFGASGFGSASFTGRDSGFQTEQFDGHTSLGLDVNPDSPVRATQERIASMKFSESKKTVLAEPSPKASKTPGKKKLSDVKANPRIAASLGLKVTSSVSSSVKKTAQGIKENESKDSTDDVPDLLGELGGEQEPQAAVAEMSSISPDVLGLTDAPPVQESTVFEKKEDNNWDPFSELTTNKGRKADAPLPEDLFANVSMPTLAPEGMNTQASMGQSLPHQGGRNLTQNAPSSTAKAFDPFGVHSATHHVTLSSGVGAQGMIKPDTEEKDPFADLLG